MFLYQQEKHQQAQAKLYHQNIESFEDKKLGLPSTKGMEAIKQKTKIWDESVLKIHKAFVSEPIVTGNYFAVTMENDITFKNKGRMQIKEICVYEVSNEKIVKEHFFYES